MMISQMLRFKKNNPNRKKIMIARRRITNKEKMVTKKMQSLNRKGKKIMNRLKRKLKGKTKNMIKIRKIMKKAILKKTMKR